MPRRIVSVGDDFILPSVVKAADENLPERLAEEELNATYALKGSSGASVAPTMILTGDSTVAQNLGPMLGPSTAVAPNQYWSARGAAGWMETLLKQRLKIISNAGIGGQRADQVAARFAVDVVAFAPGWVDIQVGTNDVSQSRTAAQIQASLTQMYDAAKAAGIRVLANTITTQRSFAGATTTGAVSIGGTSVVVTDTPGGLVGDTITIDTGTNAENVTVSAVSGSGPYTLTVSAFTKAHASGALVVNPGKMAVLTAVNNWLRSYTLSNPNIVLADINAAYTDPITGGPVAALTADGTHMSIDGAAVFGKIKADALEKVLAPQPYGETAGNAANLLPNPMLNGTTGAFAGFGGGNTSGTLPDGWTLYGDTASVVAASRVNRTDGIPGTWLQFAVSSSGANYLDFGAPNVSTGWSVGDTIWAEIEVQMDPDVVPPTRNGPLQNLSVYTQGGASLNIPVALNAGSSDGASSYWVSDGVLRTNLGIIAAGTTTLQFRFSIAITSGTVRVGRARLIKGAI